MTTTAPVESNETVLTPANVKPGFGLLHSVALDDQVDAQPLVVPGVMITAGKYQGTTHDVVYVATENNTVYAIDVHTGTILLNPNFGHARRLSAWAAATTVRTSASTSRP